MRITVKRYKSIVDTINFEVPNFTVLTGENGSGKTHLFEAISNNQFGEVHINDKQIEKIRYISYNQLNPNINHTCSPSEIIMQANMLWSEIQELINRFKVHINEIEMDTLEQDIVYQQSNQEHTKRFLRAYYKKYNVLPSKLKEEDIMKDLNLLDSSGDNLFSKQFAYIFKAYHIQHFDNRANKLYIEDGIKGLEYLDEEEFKIKYGNPPWEVVNSILERMNLPYIVNNPMNTKRDANFTLLLCHKVLGHEISINDLSTGEKTLMSLALALYNTTGGEGQVEMLILDEPDAPLHPSMSKLMLEILEEEIVLKQSIPVIISTHSPTTIACAPAYSLYKITKEEKTPIQCNFKDSIQMLTYGIPNLHVSLEHRRQVFVEHNYDVMYYEALFSILSRRHNFSTKPYFIPPHNHNGSNCTDVIRITTTLRNMGNTQVYGLIDWDGTNEKENQLIVLGLGNRYAIENYLFDPHLMGLYLIKKDIVRPHEIGIEDCNSYIEVGKSINTPMLQKIVDFIERKILDDELNIPSKKVESKLINNESISINSELFTIRGHNLEEKYKSAWPKLNGIRGNGDSALKMDIINIIINDFPDYLSHDLLDTFYEII